MSDNFPIYLLLVLTLACFNYRKTRKRCEIYLNGVVLVSLLLTFRSSPPEVLLGKGFLKIGKRPLRGVILIKLLCNVIEIMLRYGCSPIDLLHIFRTALKGFEL